jgi:predicted ATP-binding protein involved in virulence
MDNISELHSKIYLHLRKDYPNLRFRLRQDIPRNKQKLLDGYWFWGNDKFLQLSFWKGADSNHMTYTIGWSWEFEKSEATAFFVARDSDIRAEHFKSAIEHLEKEIGALKFDKNKNQAVWHAYLKEKDPIKALDYYLKQIYPKINNYFKNNPLPKTDDSNKNFDFEITKGYFDKSTNIVETYKNKRNQISSNNKKTKENLPYALKRIVISNFQGIRNLDLLDLPPFAQWIFITGENGFGKTSFLKAIATGLSDYSVGDTSDVHIAINHNNTVIKHSVYSTMTLDDTLNEDEIINDDFSKEIRNENSEQYTIPPIAMYGVTRISNKYSTIIPPSFTQSLFENEAVFYDIQNELKIIEKRDIKRFRMLKEAIKTIVPTIEDITIDSKGDFVFYKEKDNIEKVTLDKLGAGLQGTINLVGDIIKRLENHDANKKTENLSDLVGFVLIDEIDANLHPNYQYTLPQLLTKVFPKIQFIAITHSPIPLLGAMRFNPVVLTVTRNLKDGIQIERWDNKINLELLMPNAILSSPIFNFETLFSTAFNDKKQRIRTENYYDDVVYHDRLEKDLNDLASSKKEDELLNFLKSKNDR